MVMMMMKKMEEAAAAAATTTPTLSKATITTTMLSNAATTITTTTTRTFIHSVYSFAQHLTLFLSNIHWPCPRHYHNLPISSFVFIHFFLFGTLQMLPSSAQEKQVLTQKILLLNNLKILLNQSTLFLLVFYSPVTMAFANAFLCNHYL